MSDILMKNTIGCDFRICNQVSIKHDMLQNSGRGGGGKLSLYFYI